MKKIRDQRPLDPKPARTPSLEPTNGRSMLAIAVSAALCASPQGHAQQAKADDLTLEEIVVTASLRKANMQDLPQSITVLTTEDIEKSGYKEMGDYIRDLPSVTLSQQQPGRNNIVFRGVATSSEDFYTDAQAGVYLDDQPITTNATQVSPYLVDIERVESLPGPQGTLFGSSAETGVLRIITNKPDPSGIFGSDQRDGLRHQGRRRQLRGGRAPQYSAHRQQAGRAHRWLLLEGGRLDRQRLRHRPRAAITTTPPP